MIAVRSWSYWACCGAAALALHAGGIALAFSQSGTPEDDDLGARALDISMDYTAPKVEETDLPPGPQADAATAAPDAVAQAPKPIDSEQPVEKADDTEEPDRTVAPQAERKPEETTPAETTQTVTSQAAVASEASAPAPSDTARPAATSAAPVLGTGDSTRKIIQSWQRQLVAHLDRHKRYPAGAARRKAEIAVTFVLDRRGHVLSARVSRSSGDAAFDEAALAMLRRSDPVPSPPPVLADQGLAFTLPVVFRGEGRGG